MTSLAIIGSGIAGLGAAHLLHERCDITLFDRASYVGGHTNTVTAEEDGRPVPIDTGFMVFNEVTYPNLTLLFASLGVETMPAEMSFGVNHVPSGVEYCGSSVSQLFARRRNLLNLRYLRALYNIDRFNSEANEALDNGLWDGTTLQEYATARGYGDDFLTLYLLPMASAVWSTRFEDVRDFPAMTLLRFFRNHGLLGGLKGHHQWLTVRGGAKQYVEKLTAPFRERIVLRNGVEKIWRGNDGVLLKLEDGSQQRFDKVVVACHADDALRMLGDATDDERRLLGAFRYQENIASLHTDSSIMPSARGAWAAWNYRIDAAPDRSLRATTIYWMNRLQRVSESRNYFVSIDDPGLIDPSKVLRTIQYQHPLFTNAAIAAQAQLPSLNATSRDQRTFYCGSYFRNGFHEDAFVSAIAAARAVAAHDAVWSIAA